MAGTGQRRGRRGIIGGYWGGYSLLSLSPTPRALPGKVENLTPPAAGQKRTGWSTASADRATLERCQLEPLRPDQCQHQQPGTGTGSRPPPPTICTGMHPAQQIAPPVQTEGQSSSAQRAAALAFFFCLAFQPARPAGSAARHALGVVGGRPGEKLESTRGALDTVPGYCAHHLHREGSAPPAPPTMTTPAADRRPR